MKIQIRMMRDPLTMIGGAIGGQLLGMFNDDRQQQANEENMKRQVAASKELSDYQYNLEMRKWQETGYGAQRKQMQEAGLNPALMYGMGGGGGQSSAVGGGGAGGGQGTPSSGGEAQAVMGMSLQNEMMQAQMENIKANTEKTKVDTAKTAGVDTANVAADTGLKIANTGNAKADTVLKEIQTRTEGARARVAEETIDEAVGTIIYEMRRADEEVSQLVTNNYINRATADEQIRAVKLHNSETLANIALKEAQKNNTVQMTEQSKSQVLQWVKENVMRAEQLRLEGKRTTVAELEQSVDRTFKEALIEQGQWHNFIQGMNGVMQIGTKIPVGTKPAGNIGFPRN